MTCQQTKEFFVQALYHELDESAQQAFEQHLATCASCSREFDAMKLALSVMDKHSRIEPSTQEWDSQWEQLRQKIEEGVREENRPAVIRFRPGAMPAWAYGIAAILLVAAGIYTGRTFFAGHPVPPETTSDHPVAHANPAPTPDSTADETIAYLERSRNLLIGLTNLDEQHSATFDLKGHQELSRKLIDQGNILTVALHKPDQQRTRQLIQDLQIILMQLANTELKPGVPVVELVKKGVDEKSILLKINVEAMRATGQKLTNSNDKKQSKRS